jgi:hypothetical protein
MKSKQKKKKTQKVKGHYRIRRSMRKEIREFTNAKKIAVVVPGNAAHEKTWFKLR